MTKNPRCTTCQDMGTVCENHPRRPWGGMCCGNGGGEVCGHGACHCGGAGMPCEACCSPVPADGTVPIGWGFVPDWQRGDLDAALAERTAELP